LYITDTQPTFALYDQDATPYILLNQNILMNNFDKVFTVIKSQCARQTKFAEISNFEALAGEAGVDVTKLGLYLDHLQRICLIKYSIADKYIYLTPLGKKQDKVPEEVPGKV